MISYTHFLLQLSNSYMYSCRYHGCIQPTHFIVYKLNAMNYSHEVIATTALKIKILYTLEKNQKS